VDGSIVERAVAAAVAVASEQGLRVGEAVPVGTGSNVIVHLPPRPVVARVMSGTAVLHPDPRAWLTREIDVGRFLGERMAAVVAPAKEIDPGPYVSDELWLSVWEYVEVRRTPLEAAVIGRALRDLHDTLAEYRGPLPPRSAVQDEIDWLLNVLPADAGLAAERDRVAQIILELEDTTDRQPLHGDASLSALLATSAGPRWNDFEDVCVGRVEWDVAGVLSDARDAYGEAFAAEVLAAYGACDAVALERVEQVHDLYGDLWRRYRRSAERDLGASDEESR
jgi:hypothetical protein